MQTSTKELRPQKATRLFRKTSNKVLPEVMGTLKLTLALEAQKKPEKLSSPFGKQKLRQTDGWTDRQTGKQAHCQTGNLAD